MDRAEEQLEFDVFENYPSGPDAAIRAEAQALEQVESARGVILVEGISDQIALETLARRQGRDLGGEQVVVVPMGGAHAIARYVAMLGPQGANIPLTGMCDAAEEPFYRRAFGEPGVQNGEFSVCVKDLEQELIRASEDPLSLLESSGDLGSFRTLQKQPEWRGRRFPDQLHRWLRAGARRNLRYSHLLVASVPLDSAPAPLLDVLSSTR